MTLADLVFGELRRRDVSLRELARLAGVSHSTLSKIVNHGLIPEPETVRKLAPILGRSEDDLLTLVGHRSEKSLPPRPQPLMPYAIPVYDMYVSAGVGEPHIQQYLYMGPDEGVPADWFGIPVRGECMVPVLFPEDVVIVNPNAEPRDGDMVVFDLEHEKALVKWFIKRKKGVRFEPENGDPIPFDEATMRIVGVVMRTWRNPRRRARREYRDMWERVYAARHPRDEEE
jgi:SOS-response transcriptional repressor LexA